MLLEDILLTDNIKQSVINNQKQLFEIIPELEYMVGFKHNHPHHHLDVWNHTILALSLSKNDYDIRLSLLLHDIGKPFSYQDEEVRHFRNHPIVSSNMSKRILKRLNYDTEYINKICYLIAHHDTPITAEEINNDIDLCLQLYEIQRCDALAHHPEKLEKRILYLNEIESKILKK